MAKIKSWVAYYWPNSFCSSRSGLFDRVEKEENFYARNLSRLLACKIKVIMSLHSTTRVPVDDHYAAVVGKAIYVFAYYEWAIIWIIDYLKSGFVHEYSRVTPMTSGAVKKNFCVVINDSTTDFTKVTKQELIDLCDQFDALIVKRNALIHAHPCTDLDGKQILSYQTKPSKPLPDMKWRVTEVESVISEFDTASCDAGAILEKLRA